MSKKLNFLFEIRYLSSLRFCHYSREKIWKLLTLDNADDEYLEPQFEDNIEGQHLENDFEDEMKMSENEIEEQQNPEQTGKNILKSFLSTMTKP